MYTLNSDFVAKKIQNETALLNIQSGHYYVLDETATHIWEMLLNNTTHLDALVEHITDSYDVDREIAESDLTQLVQDLKSNKILLEA